MDFRSPTFLQDHIKATLAFYTPNAFDPSGGFNHYFRDDGSVYNPHHRHLVSSTRFVFNHAMAARYFGDSQHLDMARHGLDYLASHHDDGHGFLWTLHDGQPEDRTMHCYGHAFVIVAASTAMLAGIDTRAMLQRAFDIMETQFWQPQHGLYADEASAAFARQSEYRGQNANMHACEAMLWAYEATSERVYLNRAYTLASNICQRQARLADGMIWEHYTDDWQIDWDYNRDNPKHLFRPWGFQPGHHTEWAKLLCILYRFRPEPWMLTRAQQLFNVAISVAWDPERGGLYYGFAPDLSICDDDKYFWVQAESFAAAACLYQHTQLPEYLDWYDKIWQYSWQHMVDRKYGAWYRILNANNQKYSDEKSPAGKTDYHTMGACYESLRALNASPIPAR
ncbi:MAG: AGE family epimerase/isomerase [Gammaproteobacteria bacterium]|nr:AGE family epimerase/isomerase [Gammaproteobacteria bacterium]